MRTAIYISLSCVVLLGCAEASNPAADGVELSAAATGLVEGHIDGDQGAPSTTILSGPDYRSLAEVVTFTFTADEPASFECSVDGGRYQACVSPKEYPELATGSHSFRVRATDDWGNREMDGAKWSWQSCFETNFVITASAAVTMCTITGNKVAANRLAAYVDPDNSHITDATGWTGYDLSGLPEDFAVAEMSVNYYHEVGFANPINAPLTVIHHSFANNWSFASATPNDLARESVISGRTSEYAAGTWNSFTIDPDSFEWQKDFADGWLTLGITNTNSSYSHVLFYAAGFDFTTPYVELTGTSCQ